ncbi:DegT/DnrJ/EryC1/StrS family aminotransferase [Antarcticibacterium arcticum]|uniref:DegT/DnrJ/EryC1/StrS family aminotransferase n=1 Tax=Antarcticibacterium arcticum TaxID=2585771 RepID=A0A5B8YJE9_9FLAO|nr:DegT/DnrJ/EryC1/StrS family aminotransferase [Antarcticibacterium arcticum]QED36506.1 DegT/DnrJ/EryC1/StrS family aminotransferase [Antarcticibacterium arcticum]
MIPVTRTFLPPIDDYQFFLREIWASNQVANGGKLLFDLQRKIKEYLNSPNMVLTTNGTLPLQIALKVLGGQGEVITTPFSYVATTSTIVWENCTPVFVDINPEFLTIDETKIEAAITSKTTAILATHVFGNPCNVEEIEKIANKHHLKVIYDAAHCFGVKYKGRSLFEFGDISTCSFHATKLFHTGEGGAMFCKDKGLHNKLFYSHNFGHNGPLEFHGLGINAKMSELQAAMGLAVLPYVKDLIQSRKEIAELYDQYLNFKNLSRIVIRDDTEWNYSYYPVIFESEKQLLNTQKALNREDIFPRRYFYPSLNTLNYVGSAEMKISEDISKRILCLPVYKDLSKSDIEIISGIVNKM